MDDTGHDVTMKFQILGPLEVRNGDRPIDLGGQRQRAVLAMLLLEVNRPVPVERLIDAAWNEAPPTTARSQIQICVSALRRQLGRAGTTQRIRTRAPGYALLMNDDVLDSMLFDQQVRQAHGAVRDGRPAQAVEMFRAAVGLWRGPALCDIESRLIQRIAEPLTERRTAVLEECLDLELRLGRHNDVIGDLTELVAKYPLREQPRIQLMLALYRAGRQAEALEVYRQARQSMVEELGIEPGRELQRLHQAILDGDPTLEHTEPGHQPVALLADHRPPMPSTLPTDIADFTGYGAQVDQIRRQLTTPDGSERLATPISVIAGAGGAGKTKLAVHAAHRLTGDYPDGQLFAHLHGTGPRPVDPSAVLERFLRVLGVPGTMIPEDTEERAETYRDRLGRRRILVVLDDAASERQIVPLLPGTATCGVIVTSRHRLSGLPASTRIDLRALKEDDAVDLLAGMLGPERVEPERAAARSLAALCGGLPLALRIAAARLVARPHWNIADLVEQLADETRRLDELSKGEPGIRASISLSYDGLDDDARRLFRRLGLWDGRDFSGWMCAALLDADPAYAEDVLERLVESHLVEVNRSTPTSRSRYRLHGLLRAYARERLTAEEPAGGRPAMDRLHGAMLFLAEEAHQREYGGDYLLIHSTAQRWPLPAPVTERLLRDPLTWYEEERAAIDAGTRQAAACGNSELCWGLAVSAVAIFEARAYFDDWRRTHEAALDAVRRDRNTRGEAAICYSLGSLYMFEQRADEAIDYFGRAIDLFERCADDHGVAMALRNIAFLDRIAGRLHDALTRYEAALSVFVKVGDRVGEAHALSNLAQVRLETNDLGLCWELLERAQQISADVGNRRVSAQILHRIGETYLRMDELDEAADAFTRVLRIVRACDDPIGETYGLLGLGDVALRRANTTKACSLLGRALTLATSVGERLSAGRALISLCEAHIARGDSDAAARHAEHAVGIFSRMRASAWLDRAVELRGRVHGKACQSTP